MSEADLCDAALPRLAFCPPTESSCKLTLNKLSLCAGMAGAEPGAHAPTGLRNLQTPCELSVPAFITDEEAGHRARATPGHPAGVAPWSPSEYLSASRVTGACAQLLLLAHVPGGDAACRVL